MSQILNDLVIGEFQQMSNAKSGTSENADVTRNDRFEAYLQKTYNKTASLMSNSCRAVAHMAFKTRPRLTSGDVSNTAFLYGKNLGIAFQLVDDWLDFSATAEALGKPAAADLK